MVTFLLAVALFVAAVLVVVVAWLYVLYRVDLAARSNTTEPWARQKLKLPADRPLRVALFYWGSRGDLQPLAVLAQALKEEGHTVLINARPRNFPAAKTLGLEDAELFEQEEDYPEATLAPILREKQGPAMFLPFYRNFAKNLPSYTRQLDRMVETLQADVIITNEFAFSVAQLVAEKRELPLFVVNYTPLCVPSASFLCPFFEKTNLGGFLNWLSYTPVTFIRMLTEGAAIRRFRPELGLERGGRLKYYFGRWHWQYPCFLSYSGELMPVAKDLPPWYSHTGPLLPRAQEETEPVSPELAEFMEAGPERGPIVYIGVGSFSLAEFLSEDAAEQAAHSMLGAIEELGYRAILLERTFDFMLEDPVFDNPRFFMGKHFPHSWLFPRVSVIVHQAGAGHVVASARSGTPTVTVPIFDEQEHNAKALIKAGAAVRLGAHELTQESFKAAIEDALKLTDQARAVGRKVEEEVAVSSDMAMGEFRRWLGEARRRETTSSSFVDVDTTAAGTLPTDGEC